MSKNNQKNNSLEESASGGILSCIAIIAVLFVGYVLWVNSSAHESGFFGITIRLPLETKEHYCGRKSDYVFTFDTEKYEKCLIEEK